MSVFTIKLRRMRLIWLVVTFMAVVQVHRYHAIKISYQINIDFTQFQVCRCRSFALQSHV